ncbi:MAG: 50S ribosomal protein L4 [Proteobacteria bacterium]|nr:50S ribosomal protein L4 [Pseudomonadota bacterium]
MKVQILTLDAKSAGEIELRDSVFGMPSRPDILQQVVCWQLARKQQGTHKTKGVSEVSGTGAKPFRQKGTGRARQGSRYATQMRGGGIVFGPQVRGHGFDLNKKVRALGLRTAMSDKQREGKLVILDTTSLKEGKTAVLAKAAAKNGWTSALFIDGAAVDSNLARAARNLPGFNVLPQQGANVVDILKCDVLVLTTAAVEQLEARLA